MAVDDDIWKKHEQFNTNLELICTTRSLASLKKSSISSTTISVSQMALGRFHTIITSAKIKIRAKVVILRVEFSSGH